MANVSSGARPLTIVRAYGTWILTSVGAAVGVWIWRSDVLGILLGVHLDQYVYRLLDEVSFYALVLGWLVFVLWAEAFYRRGAERGILTSRARSGIAWVVGILVVGLVIYRFVV